MNIRLIGAAALVAALASAGCATTSPGYGSGYGSGSGYGNAPASCYDCGTVTRIEQGSGSRVPNATGAVIGGVLGAAAAREIAKDRTDSEGRQNTATVGGAVAG
ncbi:MAG TPA: peptidoglycan-associated outer membrane lipoprotein precursor, partial [Xanthomonadaceae bacterium]|nr:peptidoglycan-associated outer membrane lipoprotein precursor [Xanthomonadaceae bacterium]